MDNDELILSVEGVSKSYAGRRVVDRASFAERRGQILGLVGPNGAGKTTLIRILMGIVAPEEGTVRVLGTRSAAEARARVGYLPEERGLYQKQPVRDVLRYLARLKGVGRRLADQRLGTWLERLGLPDVARRKVRELSKGMQQKVQFVAAVLHEPDLLLLDEPLAGLDPVSRQQLRALLQELAGNGKTILLSSHEMAEVELLCPQVVMIHLGRIVLSGDVDAIRRDFGEHAVIVGSQAVERGTADVRLPISDWQGGGTNAECRMPNGAFTPGEPTTSGTPQGTLSARPGGLESAIGNWQSAIRRLPGVLRVERHNDRLKVLLAEDCEPSAFLASALAAGAAIDHFEIALPSLEDVFVRVVKGGTAMRNP